MIPLLLVVMVFGSFGASRWVSPKWLRWTAASLLARADAIEAEKREHPARLAYWRREVTSGDELRDEAVA